MVKKLQVLIAVLCMVFLIQCENNQFFSDEYQGSGKRGATAKGGGSGGNGGNGGNPDAGGNGGTGGLYGDLIICLRNADGIPAYQPIDGEHGLSYYPLPIKYDATTLQPVIEDGEYQTFMLNLEGEPIAEEGYIIVEASFGRLNLIRSPQYVLDAALDEAINNLTQSGVTNIKTDASGRLIAIIGAEDWLVNYDDDPLNDELDDKTIDSPRENMAIYQELLSNRLNDRLDFLMDYGFTDADVPAIAYGAGAAGADKTGTMLVDEFAYMNNWLLKWDSPYVKELPESPDVKDRRYYDYREFMYSRSDVYSNMYVKITNLNSDGSWVENYKSLLNVVPWTQPEYRISYGTVDNMNITAFTNAADDAIQVLEFIHESDLIVYSPYFTASGFNPPAP